MKKHYDFSKAEQGKFYRSDAEFRLPVYLDAGIESYLSEKAGEKEIGLSELVNELLQKEIDIIRTVAP